MRLSNHFVYFLAVIGTFKNDVILDGVLIEDFLPFTKVFRQYNLCFNVSPGS